MVFLLIFVLVLMSVVFALQAWRAVDALGSAEKGRRLAARATGEPTHFDPAMVDDLPAPARRFLVHAIQPGTPIRPVAKLRMHGEIGLGTQSAPAYQQIKASEVLALPHGFVFRVDAGRGLLRLSGSDGLAGTESWSRFWLLQLLPAIRDAGDDHRRAAFGRLVAEAVFWTPAALLPRDGILWSAVDETTARVRVEHGDLAQDVDVTVDDAGRPTQVMLQRWTNANRQKQYREQPFGGFLYDFDEIDGYRLPTRVEAGNHFGTDDYFPFYKVTVDEITFVEADPHRARPEATKSR